MYRCACVCVCVMRVASFYLRTTLSVSMYKHQCIWLHAFLSSPCMMLLVTTLRYDNDRYSYPTPPYIIHTFLDLDMTILKYCMQGYTAWTHNYNIDGQALQLAGT